MGNKSKTVKIVVFVPESHADDVRKAIGDVGGGKIGNYTYCSFSSKGTGRFKPEKGANPAVGKVENLESVPEEKVEFICKREMINDVVEAIKEVHPYEEVALDIYSLEEL